MIYLSIDKRTRDGALQLSIGDEQEGTGYRIAGPKYDGDGKTLLRHILTDADVSAISSYLRRVRQPSL